MRKLFCVYDIHLSTDLESKTLGISADDIKNIEKKAYGSEGIKKLEKVINNFYDLLGKKFEKEKVDKIYQDGGAIDWAAVAKTKPEIYDQFLNDLEEKVSAGSRSYELVLNLAKKGSEIKQTEDPKLLLEEATFFQNYVRLIKVKEELSKGKKYSPKEEEEIKELTVKIAKQQSEQAERGEKRDMAIADNINKSLKEEETGLLIIGAMHNVKPYLAKGIELEELMPEGMKRISGRCS